MKKKRKKPKLPPGRPPVPIEKQRIRRAVRYTDAEWDEIATAAKRDEITASKLIRTASLRIARQINRQRLDSHGGGD